MYKYYLCITVIPDWKPSKCLAKKKKWIKLGSEYDNNNPKVKVFILSNDWIDSKELNAVAKFRRAQVTVYEPGMGTDIWHWFNN